MSTPSSAAFSEIDALVAFCVEHPASDADAERFLRHLCSGPAAIVDLRAKGLVGVVLDRVTSASGAVPFDIVGRVGDQLDAATARDAITQAIDVGAGLGIAGIDLLISEAWAPRRRLLEDLGFAFSYADIDMRCADPEWGQDVAIPNGLVWSDLEAGGIDEYLRLQQSAFTLQPGVYQPDPAEARRVLLEGKTALRVLSDGARALAALRFEPKAAFLHSIVRDPSVKGRGFGRLVLDEARRRLPDRALSLNVVSSNRSALELYRRHGFEIVREQDVLFRKIA